MHLYSDALLQAAGDPAASCALLLNRSAAHAGLQHWQASLADANKVLGVRTGHASCNRLVMLAPGALRVCQSLRGSALPCFLEEQLLAGRLAAVCRRFPVQGGAFRHCSAGSM